MMIGDIIWEIQFQACTIISIRAWTEIRIGICLELILYLCSIDRGLHVIPSKTCGVFNIGRPRDFRLCYPPDSRYPAKLCKRGSTIDDIKSWSSLG